MLYCGHPKTRNSSCFTILTLSQIWLLNVFHSFGMVSRKTFTIGLANCFLRWIMPVVCDVPVHDSHNRSMGLRGGQCGGSWIGF